MDILWFVLLSLLLAGYFALEGFDLGVGLLLPVTPTATGRSAPSARSCWPTRCG